MVRVALHLKVQMNGREIPREEKKDQKDPQEERKKGLLQEVTSREVIEEDMRGEREGDMREALIESLRGLKTIRMLLEHCAAIIQIHPERKEKLEDHQSSQVPKRLMMIKDLETLGLVTKMEETEMVVGSPEEVEEEIEVGFPEEVEEVEEEVDPGMMMVLALQV